MFVNFFKENFIKNLEIISILNDLIFALLIHYILRKYISRTNMCKKGRTLLINLIKNYRYYLFKKKINKMFII